MTADVTDCHASCQKLYSCQCRRSMSARVVCRGC